MFKTLSANYYQKMKKDYKKAHKRYQNPFKQEKEQEQQYGHKRYKNLSEDEKQKFVEYRKKCYEKKRFTIIIKNTTLFKRRISIILSYLSN